MFGVSSCEGFRVESLGAPRSVGAGGFIVCGLL